MTFGFLLSACQPAERRQAAGEPAQPATTGTQPAAVPTARAGQAETRVAPPLVPMTLTSADLDAARLTGELRCAFSAQAGGEPLLLAAADVADDARGEALVKPGNGPVRLAMDRAGGFNAMRTGARFVGPGGLVANVVVSGDSPLPEEPSVATESPRYRALMVLSQGGREVGVDGVWECGP